MNKYYKSLSLVILCCLFLLNACRSNNGHMPSTGMLIVLTPVIAVSNVKDSIEAKKLDKAWSKEQYRLIEQKDPKTSGNCVLASTSTYTPFFQKYSDEKAKKIQQQCLQTVIDNWSQNPQDKNQALTVMRAYIVLGQQAEKNSPQEAKEYWLKALSYLQNDSITCCNQERVEYKGARNSTGHEYLGENLVLLLGKLKTLDEDNRVCSYPKKVAEYVSESKFDQKRILTSGCNAEKTIYQARKWQFTWD